MKVAVSFLNQKKMHKGKFSYLRMVQLCIPVNSFFLWPIAGGTTLYGIACA
jgi:hypothetical protein